ncbi:glycoside hydrolase family 76 protein [Baudoinia panamericana UAMH 10762]|uniref:Glycoside hydrolase family 76 protein n=1 Tax=Baudoinia panamericana (strain UAMH 10762) TaxID=717646 RepID=M2LBS3_BAUPA|nr:glycoside hydrolase family 76 protein [Baudoinia panamericana UAMH 10762]EMC91332.1 glycoside hydrolase family 76 protein [Baudoinia panamericana UAMH 10762]
MPSFTRNIGTVLLATVNLLASSQAQVTSSDAEAAYTALQQWYNGSTGLWIPSTGWWNSANCLTVIADLAQIDGTAKSEAESVFSTTHSNAPSYEASMTKVMGANAMPQTYYAGAMPAGMESTETTANQGWLNGYYDDEGWWALAWIAAYDVTGNSDYLSTAEYIFNDMAQSLNTTPCGGGIWWDKAHTYVNAIANELFLDVAAHLANRASNGSAYQEYALNQWTWFKNSGLINSQNTINDGLDNSTCQNNGQTVWSYNQGVILGALTELSKSTGDSSYITEAQTIANAAISALTTDGILHDPCEPDCGVDGSQFKGVFARNLQILYKASPQSSYATFLSDNANSIWSNDQENNQLSVVWSGPFESPANASTQSSAMDAIVAALATS